MGQVLKTLTSGLLSSNPPYSRPVILALNVANELSQLLPLLENRIRETIAEDRGDEKKAKEIGPTIENCYEKHFANKKLNSADFYQAVCETLEEINHHIGSTTFRVPRTETLKKAYDRHYQGQGNSMTKEEFQKILQEVIVGTGFTGIGAKDIIFYMFGIPVTAVLIKNRIAPKAVSNDFFIPLVTSATVFLLAKLNKI